MSAIRPSRSATPTRNSVHSLSDLSSSLSQLSLSKSVDKSKTRQWIREVLRKYLAKYVRDFLSQKKDIVPSPVTSQINLLDETDSSGEAGESSNSSGAHKDSDDHHANRHPHSLEHGSNATILPDKGRKLAEMNLKQGLHISELTVMEETALGDDRITYLSRIQSLEVKYSVGGHPEHFVHWLVKLPSQNFDERNLAKLTNVHYREVNFYSNILQQIKMWLEFTNTDNDDNQVLTLNIPTCYYAHSDGSTVFDIDLDTTDDGFPNPEFTLILDDLRAQGFGKRHFSIGLTVDEVMEAIREIAKFHATTYAMIQHSGPGLCETWSALMKWEDICSLYLDMVRQGFRHLHRFRKDYINNKSLADLMDAFLSLESNLPTIIEDLLKPLPPPVVTALIHMDLWTDNLFFREDTNTDSEKSGSSENEMKNAGKDQCEYPPTGSTCNAAETPAKELDCMILDWQMVTLGRVNHDLGILLMTSVDGTVRRNYGMLFLKFYHETFEKIVNSFKLGMPFDFPELVAQYKDSCLLATLLSVGRLELVVSEPSTLRRFFEALEDLKDENLI